MMKHQWYRLEHDDVSGVPDFKHVDTSQETRPRSLSEENVEAHVVEREQGKVLVHIGSQMISSSSRT